MPAAPEGKVIELIKFKNETREAISGLTQPGFSQGDETHLDVS